MKTLIAILALATPWPALAGAASETVTLDVRNMTCASCPLTVHRILKQQPGVGEAKVDLRTQSAVVKFDPAKGRPEQFSRAVSDAGFPASVRR